MNQEFRPTHLYVKTHNITGLKYFGKTIQKNPTKYKGSGKHWRRHIKKYGNDVSTDILGTFTDEIWCSLYALEFSHINDIVKSKEWANLKDETGFDGGFDHINHGMVDDDKVKRNARLEQNRHLIHQSQKINKTAFFDSSLQAELGKRGAARAKELGVGAVFGLSQEERDNNRKLCYTPEAIEKHKKTANERGSYNGKGNSQHNTKFIYHEVLEVSFRVKYDLIPNYLDQGWRLGKYSNKFFSKGKANKLISHK